MNDWLNRIFNRSCEDMSDVPDGSIHCVVTSPPYFALRDYNVEGQIGLEDTLDAYIERMVAVFREVRRVLRDDGTVFLNMGDSYATRPRGTDNGWDKSRLTNPARIQKAQSLALRRGKMAASDVLKEKDQMLVPHRLAIALQEDGWYLRDTIIWHKTNPMPSSVSDRCTPCFEYVFMLTKKPRYFADMDAVREPLAESSLQRLLQPTFDKQGGGSKTTPPAQIPIDLSGERS
jgi:DNA modification methylase